MKKLGLMFAAVVTALAISAPAAAVYPPAAPSLVLDPSSGPPGFTYTATLLNCTLGDAVTVTQGATSATASCNGAAGAMRINAATGPMASVSLTAPTAPGTYTVTATATPSGDSASATLTVAAAAVPAGAIPTTGSDSVPIVQIGAGLVAVGSGLAIVAGLRRRKVAAAA